MKKLATVIPRWDNGTAIHGNYDNSDLASHLFGGAAKKKKKNEIALYRCIQMAILRSPNGNNQTLNIMNIDFTTITKILPRSTAENLWVINNQLASIAVAQKILAEPDLGDSDPMDGNITISHATARVWIESAVNYIKNPETWTGHIAC